MNKILKLITYKLLLCPILVLAADDWYQIEVITFQYLQPEGEVELWASHPGEPEWQQSMFLYESEALARAHLEPEPVEEVAVEIEVAEPEPEDNMGFVTVGELVGAKEEPAPAEDKTITEIPFVKLSTRQYTMQGVEKIIEENPSYKIMSHVAWRQPALNGREVENIRIFGGKSLGTGPDQNPLWELEGLVTFKKSRFMHIEADVVLREPGSSASGSFDSPQALGLIDSNTGRSYKSPNLTTYRLKQSQRVRSDKLYYYDHPLIGMIVKITPYEPS